MFKKIMALMLLLTLFASPALAQLNLTYTSFQPGQTISSAQFTANFTAISANALNRTGGIMTGTLTLNGGTDVNGSFTIGSTNLQPFDSAGKIKEISSTYFDNLSGTNLTGVALLASPATITGAWTFSTAPTLAGTNISAIPEANISEGAFLARNAGNESITGLWNFTSALTVSGNSIEISGPIPRLAIYDNEGGLNAKYWLLLADTNVLQLTAYNDNLVGGAVGLQFVRNGSTITAANMVATTVTLTGTTDIVGTLDVSSNVDVGGNLAVSGATLFANDILTAAITVVGNQTVGGALNVVGTLSAGTFAPTTISVGDGSAVNPTLSFASDTNIGFFRLAENTIGVTAAGTTSMSIGDVLINIPATRTLQVSNIRTNTHGDGTIGTSSALYNVMYAFTFSTTSDRRAKMDIKDIDLGLDFITKLKPVNYRFAKDPGKLRYGFIAQDLVELGYAGVDTSDPKNFTMNYSDMIAPVVKSIQQLHQEDIAVAMVIRMQDAKIQMLIERIIELEKGYGGKRIME